MTKPAAGLKQWEASDAGRNEAGQPRLNGRENKMAVASRNAEHAKGHAIAVPGSGEEDDDLAAAARSLVLPDESGALDSGDAMLKNATATKGAPWGVATFRNRCGARVMTQPSDAWPVSPRELAENFRGRRFGELVLYHVKRQSLAKIIEGLMGTVSLLPKALQDASAEWIDLNNPYALDEKFWQADCGDVCISIMRRADDFLRTHEQRTESDTLLNLFQIIVLNFAYAAHKEPSSKAFIQKALGIGFLRRLLG